VCINIKVLLLPFCPYASSVEVRDSSCEWDQKLQKHLALCSNVCVGNSNCVIGKSYEQEQKATEIYMHSAGNNSAFLGALV
jgi:hypothetical protein